MSELRGPLRSFHRFTGYLVRVKTGDGAEDDPHRIVEYWLTESGDLIVSRDRWAEENRPEGAVVLGQ